MATTYTVNFSPEMTREINEISQAKHLSDKQLIERAIKTYVYLSQQAEAGNRILITNKDNLLVFETEPDH